MGREPPHYVFGHSERELQRLARQAESMESITRQFLLNAGIGRGMRVLDVGTGAGDVAFLASKLVGESGAVVGETGQPRLSRWRDGGPMRGRCKNVSFETGDPSILTYESPFDAVIGRFVLQFQHEPAGPSMTMSTLIGAGENSREACTRAADIVLSLLPSMKEPGLVAPGELDRETLADRLKSPT